MAETTVFESILVADCGTAATKVFLFDLVDGQYRFVAKAEAPSTAGLPHSDVTVGVQRAVRGLEDVLGRKILGGDGELIRPERADGTGVDTFVAVLSAGAPLRVALAGLTKDISMSIMQRAVWGTHAEVVAALELHGPGTRPEQQLAAVRDASPDAFVLAGGTESGASLAVGALADVVSLAASLIEREQRPDIVFSGNTGARSTVVERASSVAHVRPVDNVLPSLDREHPGPLIEELHRLYCEHKMSHVPGFGRLNAWSVRPVKPTSEAFAQSIRFLGRQYNLNVLGVDLGSANTAIAAVLDNAFDLTVGAGFGIGHGARAVLDAAGVRNLDRWVATGASIGSIADAVLNKGLLPLSVAVDPSECEAEQALARECLRLTLDRAGQRWVAGPSRPYPDLPPFWDLIAVAGGFQAGVPSLGGLVLLLLDGLQPAGLSTLALDSSSMLGALAALASVHPLAAAQVLEHDALTNLGTLVCPVGTARDGERVMRAKLSYPDGKVKAFDVHFGGIQVVPLPSGTRASLEMRPSRHFDIGWGHKGRGAVAEIEGGLLGLVIDARGRPLSLPESPEARRSRLTEWRLQIGA